MKQLLLKTILLFFAIVCTNCSDDNEQPTGEDSFSFFINGELYIPEGGTGIGGGKIRPFSWFYSNFDDPNSPYIFSISSGGNFTIGITVINPKLGKNILNQELRDVIDTQNTGMIVQNETIFYNTRNNQNNGTITFTEFSEEKMVGTFECTLYNDKGNELKVTKGKFNLTLKNKAI